MQAKGSCMNYDHCINYCFCPMAIRRIRNRAGNLQSSLMNPTTDQLADKIKTIPWPIALVRWFGCDPVQPMTHLSRRRDIDDPAATRRRRPTAQDKRTPFKQSATSFPAIIYCITTSTSYQTRKLVDGKTKRKSLVAGFIRSIGWDFTSKFFEHLNFVIFVEFRKYF